MEQRNNLVLQGTETFSRGQLDNVALENGALVLDSVAGRSLFVQQLHHPGCHAGLLQPERQLERPRTPGHHGEVLPGICGRGVDGLDELWQVGTGLSPVQRVQPQRGRHDLFFDGRYRAVAFRAATPAWRSCGCRRSPATVKLARRCVLAAAVRTAWEKHSGHPLNPGSICRNTAFRDPSFAAGRWICRWSWRR